MEIIGALTLFGGIVYCSIFVVSVSIVKILILFVQQILNAVANAKESSQFSTQAGVPQGAI